MAGTRLFLYINYFTPDLIFNRLAHFFNRFVFFSDFQFLILLTEVMSYLNLMYLRMAAPIFAALGIAYILIFCFHNLHRFLRAILIILVPK